MLNFTMERNLLQHSNEWKTVLSTIIFLFTTFPPELCEGLLCNRRNKKRKYRSKTRKSPPRNSSSFKSMPAGIIKLSSVSSISLRRLCNRSINYPFFLQLRKLSLNAPGELSPVLIVTNPCHVVLLPACADKLWKKTINKRLGIPFLTLLSLSSFLAHSQGVMWDDKTLWHKNKKALLGET